MNKVSLCHQLMPWLNHPQLDHKKHLILIWSQFGDFSLHNSKLFRSCGTLFITFMIIEFCFVNGVVVINSCNAQMIWCVVWHPFKMQVNVKICLKGRTKGFKTITKTMTQAHWENTRCIRGGGCLCYRKWHKLSMKHVAKKRKTTLPFEITFGNYRPYTKFDLTQQDFLKNLMLYIVKGYCFLSSIENPWLRCLIFCQCGQDNFHFENS
jgi:hypothetical protein